MIEPAKPVRLGPIFNSKEALPLQVSLPQHIAIIMDGNGRWAEAQNLPRIQGHIAGVQAVKRVVRACLTNQVPFLSLFAFSSENWARPEEEVNGLMDLFLQALKQEIEELHQHKVRIRFTGDLTKLSLALQKHIEEAEQLTAKETKLTLNIVVNYGGKWDIVQASKKLASEVLDKKISIEDISEALLDTCLTTNDLPDPDLLIRTSGEQRISNFFLWQIAYAELYFTPVYWPDFNEETFEHALREFQKRQRRFGQLTHA